MTRPTAAPAHWPYRHMTVAQADRAYEAYAALRRLALAEPHLLDNPYFTALRDSAYARFLLNFEAL